MKISKVLISGQDGAIDIYAFDDRKDPAWMFLRLNPAENQAKGIYGNPGNGEISAAKPVNINAAGLDAASFEDFADLAFAAAGGLQIKDSAKAGPKGDADKLLDWTSFMATQGVSNERTSRGEVADRYLEVGYDVIQRLIVSRQISHKGDGAHIISSKSAVHIGKHASGFDAMRMQLAASKHNSKVGLPKGMDIARAKEMLKHVDRPSSRAVQWYSTGDDIQKNDRGQAAVLYPILAGMIGESNTLSRAVDARSSVPDALTEATGLSKGALKRIQKFTTAMPSGRLFENRADVIGEDALGINRQRRYVISGDVSLETALRHLAKMPVDRVPGDDESWKRYSEILSATAIPISNALNVKVEDILGAVKSDWSAFHAALAKSAGYDAEGFDRRLMGLTTIDVFEAIDHFNRSTLIPQVLASIASTDMEIPHVSEEFLRMGFKASTSIFLGNAKNVTGTLFEIARRYSSRITAICAATGENPDIEVDLGIRWMRYADNSYPTLTGPFTASNGLVVRPLDHFDLLAEESKRLGHCVSGYTQVSRMMTSHVYSIQDPDYSRSYSTFEIKGVAGETPKEVSKSIYSAQHQGNVKERRLVSPDAELAFDEWFAAVRSGHLELNLQEVYEFKAFVASHSKSLHAKPVVSWKSVLEMDWENAESRDAAWMEWAGVLGGDWVKADRAEVIYKNRDVRELLGAMNPQAASMLVERARLEKEALAAGHAQIEVAGEGLSPL